MQINPDINIRVYTIRSYEPGQINIYTPVSEEEFLKNYNSEQREPLRHTQSLTKPFIVSNNQLIEDWHVTDPTEINQDNLKQLVDLDVEIAILGTGERIHFPDAKYLAWIQQQGIGLEVMTTEAACRTYNFLVSDGRKVAAALFMVEK